MVDSRKVPSCVRLVEHALPPHAPELNPMGAI
jgi:hypothetical protein